MPYSRAKEKRAARAIPWPDLRYGPKGEVKLFYSAEEVPPNWTSKPPKGIDPKPPQLFDKQELINALTERNIEINPTWGNAHMKKVLDEYDRGTTR